MPNAKSHAAAPDKPARTPVVHRQPETPQKAGPLPAAHGLAAGLPRPNGKPSAARAADMLTSPHHNPGAPSRARMIATMQRAVGTARVSRMLQGASNQEPTSAHAGAAAGASPASAAAGEGDAHPMQPSLTVSRPDSPSEQEAEAVAQRVAAGRRPPPITSMTSGAHHVPVRRRRLDQEDETAIPGVQRAGTGVAQPAPDAALAEQAIAARGAGSPLNPATRRALESRMGADLSDARIHHDTAANEAARALNARAFTHGKDIYMARGESENDTHLMAHELTHVVQQRSAPRAAARAPRQVSPRSKAAGTVNPAPPPAPAAGAKAPAPADATAPGVMELKGMKDDFTPPASIASYLDGQPEAMVNVRFGNIASGTVKMSKGPGGTYTIKPQGIALTHPLFARIRDAAPSLEPRLIISAQKGQLHGYIGLAAAAKVPEPGSLAYHFARAPELLGLAGIKLDVVKNKVTNTIDGGSLNLGLKGIPIKMGAVFSGAINLDVVDEAITFDGSAQISIKGLQGGTLALQRSAEGLITGRATVPLELTKSVSGNVDVSWDGRAITGEGKAAYQGEKLSGELTVKLMDKDQAAQLEEQKKAPSEAPGEAPAGAKEAAPAAAARTKSKKVEYVVFGEGDLSFAFTDWLTGTAHTILDPKGDVTIIGKITPQKEFELFKQQDYPKPLFKVEVRAAYGIPVVGNIFLFANIGMDAFAKLGPAKFYNIIVQGTYSTAPEKNKDFSIQGTFNISAAAGLHLRAEGGAGLEVLGHDIKAGVGVTGTAGIKAYAEATPIIGYRETGAGTADKKGEFFIRGELEVAGQPFLGLSGDLFVAVESPWWSPLPDKKWTWPLGEKEWPIGGSFGLLASVDYVFGSKQWPTIEFKPVDFSADKFMTDMLGDHTKPKTEPGEQKGQWKEKNSKDAEPPSKPEGKGEGPTGKVAAPPVARPKVGAGGPKQPGKGADPNARTADGKSVRELQDEATKRGKKASGKGALKGAGKEEPSARGKDKQDHDAQLKEGLAALDAVTARYAEDGATKEEVVTGVKAVRRKFKVFKSIEVIDGGETWDYEYVVNPKKKKKGPHKADEKRISKRLQFLGKTPGKGSRTGREVIERMTSRKQILTKGGKQLVYHRPSRQWYPIENTDMGHTHDAVSWWNAVGYKLGAKSEKVREWMLDPNNYKLEPSSINRSRGAKLAETYRPPRGG
jgi:hypothetical protein